MSSVTKPSTWVYHEKEYAKSTISSRSRTIANHRHSLHIDTKPIQQQEYTRKRTCSYELNYMKPTIADLQRRNSIASSKKDPVSPERRHSMNNRRSLTTQPPTIERRKSLLIESHTRQPLVESPRHMIGQRQSLIIERHSTDKRHSQPIERRKSLIVEPTQHAINRRKSLLVEPTRHTIDRRKSLLVEPTIDRRQSLIVEPRTQRGKTKVEPITTTSLNLPKKTLSTRKVKGLSITSPIVPQKSTTHRYNSVSKEINLKIEPSYQGIRDTLTMWDREMMEAFSPGTPKSPAIAIKFYGHHLSPYEQVEIHTFSRIYFVGHQADKIHAKSDHAVSNYGYDDEHGNYKSIMHDHLAYRYEVLEELGKGSFGQVVKCLDHKTSMTVAVKLIRNKKKFYAQAKLEIKILSDLVHWDPEDKYYNLKMTDHFLFRNHLCIVTECLSMNLYEFIKLNHFRGFHITLIKRFALQLLRSLYLLGKHGIIHCDLKPENILLKHPTKSTIKVIDFGSSCSENQRVYTYIQSRFYRAPEIILNLDYTKSIDMWSLGCILAELYMGVPIFPGEDEHEQLACIMEVLGAPDQKLIQRSDRKHIFFDRRGSPKILVNSRGKKHLVGTKSIEQVVSCDDPLFIDFIQQCLQWDPMDRLTPEKAFQHEWII